MIDLGCFDELAAPMKVNNKTFTAPTALLLPFFQQFDSTFSREEPQKPNQTPPKTIFFRVSTQENLMKWHQMKNAVN